MHYDYANLAFSHLTAKSHVETRVAGVVSGGGCMIDIIRGHVAMNTP